jgi:hypothetical protein
MRGGRVAGSQPLSTAVDRSPIKFLRSITQYLTYGFDIQASRLIIQKRTVVTGLHLLRKLCVTTSPSIIGIVAGSVQAWKQKTALPTGWETIQLNHTSFTTSCAPINGKLSYLIALSLTFYRCLCRDADLCLSPSLPNIGKRCQDGRGRGRKEYAGKKWSPCSKI